MPRFEVAPGFSLNVEIAGSGAPIVLLHGFTGSAAGWGDFGGLLRAKHTTIAIDIAGHGRSDSPGDLDHYRMPQVVTDLAAAVRLAGFDRCAWLGYSMGGRTALHVAAAFPGMVEKLALIGASAGIADAEGRAARVAADDKLAQGILDDGLEAFVNHWESIPLFESQRSLPEERRAAIRRGRLACNPLGLANSLRGMGTGSQEALHDRLHELAMPVLAMAGEWDPRYSAIAAELAAAVPNGRSVVVPAAGHAAQVENPRFCAEQVLAFLAERPIE